MCRLVWSPLVKTVFRPNEDKTEQFENRMLSWLLRISVPKPGRKRSCRKFDHHLSDAWRRKGAGSVITGALFGTDVSSSQNRESLTFNKRLLNALR